MVLMIWKFCRTSAGDSPMDGSSISSSLGWDISARPIATICCSPPDSVPASSSSRGNSAGTWPACSRAVVRPLPGPCSPAGLVAEYSRVPASPRAVRQFGIRGCAARMAQEFGDPPEAAIERAWRQRWRGAPSARADGTRSADSTRHGPAHLVPGRATTNITDKPDHSLDNIYGYTDYFLHKSSISPEYLPNDVALFTMPVWGAWALSPKLRG